MSTPQKEESTSHFRQSILSQPPANYSRKVRNSKKALKSKITVIISLEVHITDRGVMAVLCGYGGRIFVDSVSANSGLGY